MTETYSEPWLKTVNYFAEHSVLDAWRGSKYASASYFLFMDQRLAHAGKRDYILNFGLYAKYADHIFQSEIFESAMPV